MRRKHHYLRGQSVTNMLLFIFPSFTSDFFCCCNFLYCAFSGDISPYSQVMSAGSISPGLGQLLSPPPHSSAHGGNSMNNSQGFGNSNSQSLLSGNGLGSSNALSASTAELLMRYDVIITVRLATFFFRLHHTHTRAQRKATNGNCSQNENF